MDKLIQSIKILSKPELKEINNFIDGQQSNYGPSQVWLGDAKDGSGFNAEYRTSTGIFVPPGSSMDVLIHRAMDRGLSEYRERVQKLNMMFNYWPIPGSPETFFGREDIQILRYEPGQKYVFHHDQGDFQNQPEYFRTISTVLYLNEGFEGGGTEFPHKTFKPKPGYALYFPSNWCYPHSGQEVISGQKRVAVTWWYAIREKEG